MLVSPEYAKVLQLYEDKIRTITVGQYTMFNINVEKHRVLSFYVHDNYRMRVFRLRLLQRYIHV